MTIVFGIAKETMPFMLKFFSTWKLQIFYLHKIETGCCLYRKFMHFYFQKKLFPKIYDERFWFCSRKNSMQKLMRISKIFFSKTDFFNKKKNRIFFKQQTIWRFYCLVTSNAFPSLLFKLSLWINSMTFMCRSILNRTTSLSRTNV